MVLTTLLLQRTAKSSLTVRVRANCTTRAINRMCMTNANAALQYHIDAGRQRRTSCVELKMVNFMDLFDINNLRNSAIQSGEIIPLFTRRAARSLSRNNDFC